MLHFGQKYPSIPINIENKNVPFLIDTGAAVSVLPKHKVLSLLTHPLSSYSIPETRLNRNITAFGGNTVTVEGPYAFNINLLDMSFKHEFYLLDSPTPFIAGFDFIARAGLVIDSINRLVWSKGVVLTETLNQSFLTSNLHAENNDQIKLQSNGERMNADNDNCGSLNNNTSKRRTKINGSTASVRTVVDNNSGADSDVPEHLRLLFLTTVENNDLPSDIVHDFKQFLQLHQNTFAKSSDR